MKPGYIIEDKSGKKKSERLIYIISKDNKQYVLKITSDEKENRKEIDIYKELNAITELGFNNRVIKVYGNGKIKFDDIKGRKPIIFKFSDGKELFRITKNQVKQYIAVYNIGRVGERDLLYNIMEYDSTYNPLRKYMDKHKKVSCEFIQSVIEDLIMLNDKYGFSHWDLNSSNLLVNDELNYKFYDFDMATTTKNENYIVADGLNWNTFREKSTETKQKYGFLWDVYLFLIEIIKGIPEIKCNKIKIIIDRIRNFYNNITKEIQERGAGLSEAEIGNYITKKMVQEIPEQYVKKFHDTIKTAMQSSSLKGGRADYYKKYVKYKTKYLALRNKYRYNIS